MSALDEAVPLLMEAAFRLGLFLSFRGRMVSLLGFKRMLPPSSRPTDVLSPAPELSADCGIEATVSVSTVIFRVPPSDCLDFADGRGVYLLLTGTVFGLGALTSLAAFLLHSSLLFPSLSLSPIFVCFSALSSLLLPF